jgi:hypothetical protein
LPDSLLARVIRFFRPAPLRTAASPAPAPRAASPPRIVPLIDETTARFPRETVTVWIGDARFEAYRI